MHDGERRAGLDPRADAGKPRQPDGGVDRVLRARAPAAKRDDREAERARVDRGDHALTLRQNLMRHRRRVEMEMRPLDEVCGPTELEDHAAEALGRGAARQRFGSGKALFAVSDIVAGWLILAVLKRQGMSEKRALKYACAWLLNPMVASISTRGSSEGLLCVMVMALLWAVEMRHISLAGVLLGLSVHFKIYPFIYGVSILWALEPTTSRPKHTTFTHYLSTFVTRTRITFLLTSLTTFFALNMLMYAIYGHPFVQHTFLHHVTRLDHRHNFSPYNTLLYLSSARSAKPSGTGPSFDFSRLAFVPQLLLSTLLLPLALAKHDLPATLLAQTFAFVTFNKVCTSQYFLWYLIFLPLYLPDSSFIAKPRVGVTALVAWVASQALWLQQGYELEFLGRSTFVPGLWISSLLFFAVNVWILGIIVEDVSRGRVLKTRSTARVK